MKQSKGMTLIEVLIVLAIVLIAIALIAPPIVNGKRSIACKELHDQIEVAKNRIAMDDGLRYGERISITRLQNELPTLSVSDRFIICPHKMHISLGRVGEALVEFRPHAANDSVDNPVACSKLLNQIQRAKFEVAKSEKLRWNEIPTLEQLSYAGGTLTEASGTVHCPWGGTIIIGAIGEVPTCSLGAKDSSHRMEE